MLPPLAPLLKCRGFEFHNIGMCQVGMFLNLEAIAEMYAQLGRLAIESTPDGAEVLVGGRRAGKTPLAGPVPVDPGLHTVRVGKDGFDSFETRVTVASASEVGGRVLAR